MFEESILEYLKNNLQVSSNLVSDMDMTWSLDLQLKKKKKKKSSMFGEVLHAVCNY